MARNPRQPRRPATSETGGHTALSPERQAAIVADIRAGAFAVVAARKNGVSVQTFGRWMRQGRDAVEFDEDGAERAIIAPEPYRSFRAAIEEAEAQLEVELTQAWTQMARRNRFDNPQGISSFLSKRFRDRWAEQSKVEVSGPDGGPIEVSRADDDDVGYLAGVLDALARAGLIARPRDEVGATGEAPAEPEPVHPA